MQQGTVSDVIRKYFTAFLAQDRKTLEEGLSDDFTFTSPHDDHIVQAGVIPDRVALVVERILLLFRGHPYILSRRYGTGCSFPPGPR